MKNSHYILLVAADVVKTNSKLIKTIISPAAQRIKHEAQKFASF